MVLILGETKSKQESFQQSKQWADGFTPEIQRILGSVFFTVASRVDDQERNTDLIIFMAGDMRFGCRVRSNSDISKKNYLYEFTIRAGRPSGKKTELHKILDGWGNYFFYGFSDRTGTKFLHWFLGDLEVFRQSYHTLPRTRKDNTDNSSWFEVFSWFDVPAAFFVAFSDPLDRFDRTCSNCGSQIEIGPIPSHGVCYKCMQTVDYSLPIDYLAAAQETIEASKVIR